MPRLELLIQSKLLMNSTGKNNLVYLGLGSNIGNRFKYLQDALNLINENDGIIILKVSNIYETEPWGFKSQGSFLNMAVESEVKLTPDSLLNVLKNIELKLGRTVNKKWHQREIDIDILFFGDLILDTDVIKIPHPEIPNRNFVLKPLNDLIPDFIHPVLKKTVNELLKKTNDESNVKLYKIKFDNFSI